MTHVVVMVIIVMMNVVVIGGASEVHSQPDTRRGTVATAAALQ